MLGAIHRIRSVDEAAEQARPHPKSCPNRCSSLRGSCARGGLARLAATLSVAWTSATRLSTIRSASSAPSALSVASPLFGFDVVVRGGCSW